MLVILIKYNNPDKIMNPLIKICKLIISSKIKKAIIDAITGSPNGTEATTVGDTYLIA